MASLSHLAFVALGSNLGNSRQTISRAMDHLQQFAQEPLLRSSLWRTDPVDCPPGSAPFINALVGLAPAPAETPVTLLLKLQALERQYGRRPKLVLNEPRPLDLDLIAFGAVRCATDQLTLPHPRAHLRRFVLQPLEEIAPDLLLPGQSKTVRQLLHDLGSEQRVSRIAEGG